MKRYLILLLLAPALYAQTLEFGDGRSCALTGVAISANRLTATLADPACLDTDTPPPPVPGTIVVNTSGGASTVLPNCVNGRPPTTAPGGCNFSGTMLPNRAYAVRYKIGAGNSGTMSISHAESGEWALHYGYDVALSGQPGNFNVPSSCTRPRSGSTNIAFARGSVYDRLSPSRQRLYCRVPDNAGEFFVNIRIPDSRCGSASNRQCRARLYHTGTLLTNSG